MAGIVFVIIFGATAVIWWKFRDDHSTDEFPEQIHGNSGSRLAGPSDRP
ncbi:MAG: hypothetical protein Ct9H300mP31_00980 [Acidimicrobiaceae bacterium]|nr:MAG: hypothetical protein Ct9H300mP31_00980 [Acidimicrobiaceae bacterium]